MAVTVIVLILVLPLLLITGFFACELLIGLATGRTRYGASDEQAVKARAVIVVPAHNEEAILAGSLGELTASAQDIPILLIADNCSDRTAEIARGCGVRVVERFDAVKRGKGFALARAAEELAGEKVDVVIVVDADCRIDQTSLRALVAAVVARGAPAQALNWMKNDGDTTPMVKISNFALLLKNLVRQRGLQRMIGQVHLTGTGMAIPGRLFTPDHFATASIVEDMKVGLDLAEQGHPAVLVEQAKVWSMPSDREGTIEQRKRWEGGYFTLARSVVPPTLWRGVRLGQWRAIGIALDLAIPPLVLFVLASGAALVGEALLAWLTPLSWGVVAIHLALFAACAVGIVLAWWKEGRALVGLSDLLRIPAYILWKIPLYLGLMREGSPRAWARATRTEERTAGKPTDRADPSADA